MLTSLPVSKSAIVALVPQVAPVEVDELLLDEVPPDELLEDDVVLPLDELLEDDVVLPLDELLVDDV